tara:strand:+ start:1448 stop:1696 length:249 start_codon:yes stop_codon:yes gene_type:complete
MKVINKTYVDNGSFMEFIDEIATHITRMNFGKETTIEVKDKFGFTQNIIFTNEAQDYYNQIYDEYEMMANNIIGVYSDNELY